MSALGEYMLKTKLTVTLFTVFALLLHGASDVAPDTVFAKKGDSVTLHTNITINQRERFKWYFVDALIAQINGDRRYICTDVQCNKEDERFRGRLELDLQSGDLTITNINTSDEGLYRLQTFSSSHTGNTFKVLVNDVVAETKRKSVKEGDSITLDTPEVENLNDVKTWYFNDTLVAEISGDQGKICTDDQCKERFRDRLKLDQTGSLIITDTRNTDSGLYKLHIKSRRNRYSITSIHSFSVSVTDSGLSLIVKAIIYVAVLLLTAAAVVGVICYCLRSCKNDEKSLRDRRGSQQDQCKDTDTLFPF